MRNRSHTVLLSGMLVAVTAVCAARSLDAQAAKTPAQTPAKPAPARAAATLPRTTDGHPDFQGVYDVATTTPIERPAEAKGRPTLTNEEAAAAEAYDRQHEAQDAAPISGDRKAPAVGGERVATKTWLEQVEQFAGGGTGGYNRFWLEQGRELVKVDGQTRSSILIDPPDGKMPPMKPEARQRNARLRAATVDPSAGEAATASGPPGAFDGPESRPLAERCLLGFNSTAGPPSLPNYFYNNLKQIVQTADTVLILNEMVHDARVVRIGGKHVPPTIRRWMGDSIGWWEGDTLVVDTTNFTGKTQFNGSSDQLHVVERIRRIDANTLLYRFTIEDPSTWDRAWTGEYPWKATKDQIYEYACHEGNYAMGGHAARRASEGSRGRREEAGFDACHSLAVRFLHQNSCVTTIDSVRLRTPRKANVRRRCVRTSLCR